MYKYGKDNTQMQRLDTHLYRDQEGNTYYNGARVTGLAKTPPTPEKPKYQPSKQQLKAMDHNLGWLGGWRQTWKQLRRPAQPATDKTKAGWVGFNKSQQEKLKQNLAKSPSPYQMQLINQGKKLGFRDKYKSTFAPIQPQIRNTKTGQVYKPGSYSVHRGGITMHHNDVTIPSQNLQSVY